MVLRGLSLIDELTGLYDWRAFLSLAVQQLKSGTVGAEDDAD